MTDADLLLVGQPTPDGRAVDRNEPVVDLLWVLRIEFERPIDPDRRIPLLLLALVIQGEQLGALVFVFPGERGLSLALESPPGLLDRQLIAVHRGHAVLLGRLSAESVVAALAGFLYGRMWCTAGPVRLSGAARSANSQRSGRVFRGSMISSIQNVSAERNGERNLVRRASISPSVFFCSGAASSSAPEAASMPPPS